MDCHNQQGCEVVVIKYFGVLTFFLAFQANAGEITIVDVHRNIPLSDSELTYRDFYLNGGNEAGLKKDMVVTVVRKMAIKDSSGTQSYGDVIVSVGQLKIIAVFNRVAVAREFKLISRENEPLLEQIGLMNGDQVQTEGNYIDKKKNSAKKSES